MSVTTIERNTIPTLSDLQCKKRNGETVPFDQGKITKALWRCFNAVGLGEDATRAEIVIKSLTKGVLNSIRGLKISVIDVEHVQRLVIQQLWIQELWAAAEHYQNYREEHRKARLKKPIDPDVAARVLEDQKHFPSDLQYYQFMSKFSRWKDSEKRRETWHETTYERVMPWLRSIPEAQGKLTEQEWRELSDAMYNLEVSPAMRVVQMAGPALDRCNVGAYNCLGRETQFITRDGVQSFADFCDGDTTFVLTHAGAWRRAKVKCYGKQKLHTYTFRRGRTTIQVRATTNHRWILKGGDVTDEIKVGDKICKAPCPAASWDYDKAEPFEKLAWAYGYVFGDGTRVKKDGQYRYSMVRLCGVETEKFAERFEELGFASSRPLSYGGDIVVYTGAYLKTVPPVDQDLPYLTAFVRGYLDADGQKQTCRTSMNTFGSIQVTGEAEIEFVRTVFPMVGYYITREEEVAGETNYGERSARTIRFGLVNNYGDAPNSYHGLTEISEEGSTEDVWCLEVEGDRSFVLPSGLVTGNCAYAPLDDIFAFPELLYILMQGTGQGFSCENKYVRELPRIKPQRNVPKDNIKVDDSTEGWCDAYYELLQRLWAGYDAHMDVTGVRKKGAILKTKGGRASGPEPYLELICYARKLIKRRADENGYFTDIDAHDLACKTGQIVQVGGVRRAALMSLSDLTSQAMREAKSGNWYEHSKHRSMANNSGVYNYTGHVPVGVFMTEWNSIYASNSGERGIFNRMAALKYSPKRRVWGDEEPGCNPCAEILLRPKQFCNLSIVIARAWDTVKSLCRKVRLAAIFGKLQSLLTKFRYIRPGWKKNCEEERLLGVDVTGHADCPLLHHNAPGRSELLRKFRQIVEDVDIEFSKRFNVNRSAANTTVKPGGDSSVLFDCASGVSARFAKHQMRWVRETKDSPIAQFLMDSGVPNAPAPEAPDSLRVFGFPRQAPEGAVLVKDMSAKDQFYNWLDWRQNYAEHSVSATLYVEEKEWPELGGIVYNHIDQITGLSFLPRDNGGYTYAPNEELSAEQYEKAMNEFPDLNWSKLSEYESEDHTETAQTFACVGGGC